MNDFTKKELENISYALYSHNLNRDEFKHEYDKVESLLIKQYCSNNDHSYEFSRGHGYCENCGKHENE
jgi:hypothetical protein